MKKKDVVIGGEYVAKVSGKLTTVRIKSERYGGSGWIGVNVKTGREVRIRTAARLRNEVVRREPGASVAGAWAGQIKSSDRDALTNALTTAIERAVNKVAIEPTLDKIVLPDGYEIANSWLAPGVPCFIKDESADEREARILAALPKKQITAKWCDCGVDTGFHSYPGDGECECGMHKHHVHGLCGHVVQVG